MLVWNDWSSLMANRMLGRLVAAFSSCMNWQPAIWMAPNVIVEIIIPFMHSWLFNVIGGIPS